VEPYLHSPNTPLWRGAQLKQRDKFTFTFMYIIIAVLSENFVCVIPFKIVRYINRMDFSRED
jgi:hypothetical protein